MTLNPHPIRQTLQLEDIILETAAVAMIRQDVPELSKQHRIVFEESYDDLDLLVYTVLSFPHLQSRVALVRHTNSPTPGVEICVRHDEERSGSIVDETLHKLDLTSQDLIWIHPNYHQELTAIFRARESNRSS
jgi:hypothetical protein